MFIKRSSTKNSQKQNNIVYDSKIMFSLLGIKLEDGFLETHSNQVSVYCHQLGKALGMEGKELKELELSGLLHDVGKSYIPKDIINKPGKLTESEWKIIKAHSNIGFEILSTVKEYTNLAKYARYHHERIDGSGYPEGLKGEEIPLPSRIICVVDAYESNDRRSPLSKSYDKKSSNC
ncbi:MAG: HD domain-containing protein [Candidatus Izimaplasma sp.]|nr:HD domain-containing protein [Candidatus Izimaplasma bacterium]